MMPLKVITEYSLLKSLIKFDSLFAYLKKNDIHVCGICDDNLYGVIDFYVKCKEKDIKPIIGLEVTFDGFIVNLYAKNYLGYQKLIEINSNKTLENFNLYEENLENVLVVLPYESISLCDNFFNKDNIFLGYKNKAEKKNVKLLTNNIVYINDIRCFLKDDIKYLEYLKMLGGNFEYDENVYLKKDIDSDDLIYLERFIKNIDIVLPTNNRYIPVFKAGVDSDEYLKVLAFKGLEKRFNGIVPDKYKERLEHELEVIKQMKFSDYFLIVYDYVLYAKKNNILVGPGRGSAAGSLVSYVIGITNIDPIKYDLLFARFLNPSRKKMPDIDIDFEDTKRMQVIEYVKEKYGKDKVALGLTFNTYKSRLILREMAKVLDVDTGVFEKFIKNINSEKTLKENLENDVVKKYVSMYPEINNLFNVSLKLEGLKKNISTHAAGVVICSENLSSLIPVINEDSVNRTGVALDYLEKFGLLKMDFLALTNLSIITGVVSKIDNFKIENISLDEKEVYEIFKTGNTDDVFQFESRYAKDALKKIKPENFEELAIAIALVRPGPSNQIDEYIKNKNSKLLNVNPDLEDVLKSTHGVIIFQEQVMKITQIIAGYTEFEADNMRAIISKKNEMLIEEEEKKFIKKALENGYEDSFVNDLFSKIKRFALYGFNKAHSVSYALIAYQIAYLKVKYPVEFSLYNLEKSKSDEDKKKYLSEIKKTGIKILKPNINVSDYRFKIKNNYLLLPFNMIKGISENVIKVILERRENGYKDIFDFVTKCYDVMDKDVYETLVLAGVFDLFNVNQHRLILNKEIIFNYASLNDEFFQKPLLIDFPEYDEAVLRENEYKYYGNYLGNHPCSIYHDVVKIEDTINYLFKNISMCVLIEKISLIMTKNNEQMAFLDVSDETGDIQMTLFPEVYKKFNDIKEGEIVFVEGKSSKRFDKYQIIVNNIKKKVN